MPDGYDIGEAVKWKWGQGWGRGRIQERFTKRVTLSIDETEVTRGASPDDPAYLILQEDEARVLKSHSEVQKDS